MAAFSIPKQRRAREDAFRPARRWDEARSGAMDDCLRDIRARPDKIGRMITKNLGMLLLAIYLILVGIVGIFGVSLGAASIVLPILALVAGILILLGK